MIFQIKILKDLVFSFACTQGESGPYLFLITHFPRVLCLKQHDNHNLKYIGIDSLGRIIKINPDFVEEHQLAVIDCLEVYALRDDEGSYGTFGVITESKTFFNWASGSF